MKVPKRRNLVPVGVLGAVLLSVAVAWAYQGQQARERECLRLYAAAMTAADSARVDSTAVAAGWASALSTCGELRLRSR